MAVSAMTGALHVGQRTNAPSAPWAGSPRRPPTSAPVELLRRKHRLTINHAENDLGVGTTLFFSSDRSESI